MLDLRKGFKKHLKREFRPKDRHVYSSKILASSGETLYNWDYAYCIGDKLYYTTDDVQFPTSEPIPITDLDDPIVKEKL